jgi:hypothetical protein
MAKPLGKRKCKSCQIFFPPDQRNAWHQEYCTRPECRKASKAASQQRWMEKEKIRDYFRPDNIQRVREWRKTHPGYWRPKPAGREEPDLVAEIAAQSPKRASTSGEGEPLQDLLIDKGLKNPLVKELLPVAASALQDLVSSQGTVLIGLIAHLTGTALQDDIAITARRLQQLGHDILNGSTQCEGEIHDREVPHLSPACPEDPQPVQLGGSPAGP